MLRRMSLVATRWRMRSCGGGDRLPAVGLNLFAMTAGGLDRSFAVAILAGVVARTTD